MKSVKVHVVVFTMRSSTGKSFKMARARSTEIDLDLVIAQTIDRYEEDVILYHKMLDVSVPVFEGGIYDGQCDLTEYEK